MQYKRKGSYYDVPVLNLLIHLFFSRIMLQLWCTSATHILWLGLVLEEL